MAYDDDASSVHSRSDQDTDSDDDELQSRARNSRELLAADRIVLMEEEETDKLVADAWTKQERQRRGSGLAMPQSLKIFGRRPSMTRTKSTSSFVDDANSEKRGPRENVREKRDRRRVRRQHRKKRLMEDAQDGEDGELMYEMERGVIKDGSSTGESSDMEGSDDLDRRKLHVVTGQKTEKSRRWRRWLLIHLLIAIGFAILVLLAWKLSKARKSPSPQKNLKSNGTALFLPTTLLISLDGFRADFLQRGLTPTLNTLIKEGVSPKHMHPSFPSVTFPNHHTIATGLYPESHGIVGNTFWDPELETDFYYTDTTRSMDPKWWGGEPFWVTAEKQGVRTALHMWPGSEAHIMNTEPSYIDFYNHDELLDNKVASILGYLDRPGYEDASLEKDEMRPQLIAAYIGEVDANGHKYGPNSTEIKSTIESVDAMLAKIFHGLESRNLTDIVNVIVVSDHGMATTDKSRLVQLDDLVDMNQIERTEGWPSYGLRPKNEENLQQIYQGILEKTKGNPNVEVYLRDNGMPERYHFSNNPRIAPLWIVPKAGWAIVKKDEYVVAEIQDQDIEYTPRGIHGYDHEDPLMRAIFIARGPAFPHPPNSEVEVFRKFHLSPSFGSFTNLNDREH